MGHRSIKSPALDSSEQLESLVVSAQKGDSAAFTSLMEKSQTKLFRLFLYLTNNRQLAEDLTQDTFIRAYEKLKTLREPKNFRSWLHQMGRNVFLAHVRLHKNSKLHPLEKAPEAGDEGRGSSLTGLSIDIHAALSSLDADERWLVLLVDYQEHAYSEAAEIIGVSEAAVRSRLHRARQQLADYFNSRKTF